MAFVIVNIGSNLGDRRLNLSRAMRAIAGRFGDFELSHAVESEPWGFDSTNTFVNIGMAFHSDLPPLDILHALRQIERSISAEAHRDADGGYRDRVIDIDIVAIDRLTVDTPELKLPHPHLEERRFFLEPLAELAPAWTHPAHGLTASQMLARLGKE
ncbi:MAG: 2-amino-4-hydroxy-6-hydroxymethyldihydropteridine diphosphokinase [Bacteroidales bacterium]|nr:2-amino-4-hydroxy-6-hydroxymethyldihydropteridine diphosphokinase [Bacteroidales bacterium]